MSKSVTGWDALARQVFATPEAFAFAAMVLGAAKPATLQDKPRDAKAAAGRVNVIELAA